MATHRIDPAPHTVVQDLDPGRAPFLVIDPGDTLVLSTLDAAGFEPTQADVTDGSHLVRSPLRRPVGGHSLIGPIGVRGARAGDVLEVHLREVHAGSWGWGGAGGPPGHPTYAALGRQDIPGFHLGWRIDGELARSHVGDVVPVRPFPGIVGMPPPEPGAHSTTPPRRWGGNLDCRELVAGSRLFLPIPVDGALLHVGDGHAAQGDGECSGVAIECPLERLVLDVHLHPGPLDTPRALLPDGRRMTLAVDPSLDVAWPIALNALLEWVSAETDRPVEHVLALSSVWASLHITQVANGVCGVHAIWSEP